MNDTLTSKPSLLFHPERIGLAFDPAFASFLLDLRDTGELSRQTILSQFDMDQDDEARFRRREAAEYDNDFQTQVPGAPARTYGDPTTEPMSKQDQKRAGRKGGGTKNGGGAAPGSGQGEAPRRPRKRSDGSQPKPPAKAISFLEVRPGPSRRGS